MLKHTATYWNIMLSDFAACLLWIRQFTAIRESPAPLALSTHLQNRTSKGNGGPAPLKDQWSNSKFRDLSIDQIYIYIFIYRHLRNSQKMSKEYLTTIQDHEYNLAKEDTGLCCHLSNLLSLHKTLQFSRRALILRLVALRGDSRITLGMPLRFATQLKPWRRP